MNGEIGRCRGHLLHYSFAGLTDLLFKMNRYTDLSARQMFQAGRRCALLDLTVRPSAAFFKTFFLKLGFLDGVEGLEVSVANAMSTFAKYMKLRELESTNPPRER